MQDSLNEKVVPWIKSFADDVDTRNAALQFTSDHLEKCRKRRSSSVSGSGMMLFVGFLLLLFVIASAWNQLDFEIYEFDNKSLYKLVNFVGGMFPGRKDER